MTAPDGTVLLEGLPELEPAQPPEVRVAKPVEKPKDPAAPEEKATEAQLRQRIETAWPGLGNRLSLNSEWNYRLDLNRCSEQVTDLTPLKGMPLTWLSIAYCGQVKDLTPLRGMKLKWLSLGRCRKMDLKPLQGMELDFLDLAQDGWVDLTQLQGMKIKQLFLWNCDAARDLKSLKGIQFSALNLDFCPVQDLTPLKGIAITGLSLKGCGGISDLTPLNGMPLTWLNIKGCGRVQDLTPLKDLPLKELGCDFKPERDTAVLRSIKTLEMINDKPAAQFWNEVGGKP